jgi:hypothetical protein
MTLSELRKPLPEHLRVLSKPHPAKTCGLGPERRHDLGRLGCQSLNRAPPVRDDCRPLLDCRAFAVLFQSSAKFRFFDGTSKTTRNAMEMTVGDPTPRAPRPLRRRLVRTSLGSRTVAGEPSRPDADASDERIVEL